MAMELHFTSATKGLKPGSTGFCTVALTAGMPAPMIQKLESLGGYRPVFEVGSPDEWKNPPVYAHWRVSIGGHFYSVLSHICFAGADHQGRFNKYAHHLVLDTAELTAAGPAWVMMQPEVMEKHWTGEPRILPANSKLVPGGTNPLGVCEQWKRVTGDAGWAGQLAQAFVLDATKPVYVIYNPGTDMLPLINEAIALLPEPMRWRVTFSTYFDQLQAGLLCSWRCCVAGTAAARAAPGNATSGVLIDLTAPLGEAPPNRFVDMARTGTGSSEGEQAGADRKFVVVSPPVGGWAPEKDSSPLFDDMLDEVTKPKPAQAGTPAPVLRVNQQQAAAARYVPPRRPNLLLWAGAILWPLLVLGVGFGIVIPKLTKPPAPPAQGEVAELAAKVKKLESDLGNQKGLIGELETGKERAKADADAKAGRIADLETQVATLTREKDDSQNRLMTANLELKKLRGDQVASNTDPVSIKPKTQPDTKPPPEATKPKTTAVGGIVFVDMKENRLVVTKLSGIEAEDRTISMDAPKGAAKLRFKGMFGDAVEIVNPAGGGPDDDGKVQIFHRVRDGKRGPEIGTIRLEGNQVVCDWHVKRALKESGGSDGRAKAPELPMGLGGTRDGPGGVKTKAYLPLDLCKAVDDAMPYAVLELMDQSGKPLRTYQFCSPEAVKKSEVVVGEPAVKVYKCDAQAKFAVGQPDSGWLEENSPVDRRAIRLRHAKKGVVMVAQLRLGDEKSKSGNDVVKVETVMVQWDQASRPVEIQKGLDSLNKRMADLPGEMTSLNKKITDNDEYLAANDPSKLKEQQKEKKAEIAKRQASIEGTIEELHRRPNVAEGLKKLEILRQKRARAQRNKPEPVEELKELKKLVEESEKYLKDLEDRETEVDRKQVDKLSFDMADIENKLKSGIPNAHGERGRLAKEMANTQADQKAIPGKLADLKEKQDVVNSANLTLWVVSKPSDARLAEVSVRSK